LSDNSNYTVIHQTPSVDTYRALRAGAGLSPKTEAAAAQGLPNTLFAVQVLHHDQPIAMGRVIGDGGCFYQVVDIAVLPDHQDRGIGNLIMAEIAGYIQQKVPESGYVSLPADGQAQNLYAKFGFTLTAPASVGMSYKKDASGASLITHHF
jgi:ribosomal protein S18 acetylase RimI-like enzyme